MDAVHCIGVISDTHLPKRGTRIPDAALRQFAGVELIIHAGDHSTHAAIDQLAELAPVVAVRGNVEDAEIAATLPLEREIVVGGCAIGVIHILGDRAHYARNARREFPEARVVIFGHSHIPYLDDQNGLLLLNPGSATDRRRQPQCTIALLTITDGEPLGEIVALG